MDSPRSLLAHWQRTLQENCSRVAVIDLASGSSVTFEGLEKLAEAWIRVFSEHKLSPGDRVLVQLPNSADFVAVFLAMLRMRLVMTPVDSKLGRKETASAAHHTGAKLLLTKDGECPPDYDTSRHALPGHVPDGTALLKLTSGSTGAPKGIVLTDAQLIADATNISSTMGIGASDLNFGVIPLSHSYGFDNLVLPLLIQGTPMAVLDEALPRAILEGIISTRATVFPAVPVLLEALGKLTPPVPKLDSLRTVISAGAPLSAEVYQKFRQRFGIKVHQFYGSSECGGITYDHNPSDELVAGCVGTPLENVTVDLTEDGRVRVRGANVASGYFPPPTRDEENVFGEGAFLTGDIGRVDEGGRLHLLGRMGNVINVAGKKVNPIEVEACIVQFDGVRSVAVVGVADGSRNEWIVAFVVPQPARSLVIDLLVQHCRGHLAPWKVPRLVKVLQELPVNARGKLDREALRKLL